VRRVRRRRVLLVILLLLVLGGAFVVTPGSPGKHIAQALQHRECFIADGDGGEPNSTVGLGDSITSGYRYGLLNLASDDSYFDVLSCEDHSPISRVANSGVRGQTSAQILARTASDAVDLQPAVVFVIAGTNDVLQGHTGDTIDNLTSIADQLDQAKIRAIFGTLPPSDLQPEATADLNDQIRQWAAAGGVQLVDYWQALAGEDGTWQSGMTEDGIHPSPSGARVMADLAAQALAGT
jgi:lysophospholipase L1-like esterase